MNELTCIGCGCTDAHPCVDENGMACSWVSWVEQTGQGLCSCCALLSIDELVEMWEHPRNLGVIV
jgi:hypothetical protein